MYHRMTVMVLACMVLLILFVPGAWAGRYRIEIAHSGDGTGTTDPEQQDLSLGGDDNNADDNISWGDNPPDPEMDVWFHAEAYTFAWVDRPQNPPYTDPDSVADYARVAYYELDMTWEREGEGDQPHGEEQHEWQWRWSAKANEWGAQTWWKLIAKVAGGDPSVENGIERYSVEDGSLLDPTGNNASDSQTRQFEDDEETYHVFVQASSHSRAERGGATTYSYAHSGKVNINGTSDWNFYRDTRTFGPAYVAPP